MALQPPNLGAMLSFISQKPQPMQAPSIQSLMLPIPNEQIERGRNDRYREEAAQWAQDNPNQPTSLMELRARNQSMLASGNPILQKQALANMQQTQQGMIPTTSQKDFDFAQKNPGFDPWLERMKKAGAVNMGNNNVAYGQVPQDVLDKLGLKGTYFYDKNGIPQPVGDTTENRQLSGDEARIKTRTDELAIATTKYVQALAAYRKDRTNLDLLQAAQTAKQDYDVALAGRMNWQGEPSDVVLERAANAVPGPMSFTQVLTPGDPTISGIKSISNRYGLDLNIDELYDSSQDQSLQDVASDVKDKATGAKDAILRIGTVKNGYRYKGGNPNDPASWEELK